MLDSLVPYGARWLGSLEYDLSRYAMFAIGVWLAIWVLLAKPLAGCKVRPDSPPARQLVFEFLFSIRSVAIFSTIGLSLFVLERAGLLAGPAIGARLGPLWGWTTLALMIVAHDAYFYWAHRLMHRPKLFRVFHRRHHRSHNPSPFTAYSFDLAEAAVHGMFAPLWMIVVPTPWWVTTVFLLHQLFRNTIGHCGYELFPARRDGKPLIPFLTTVTHHDLHHGQAGWNYGLYFTWWDRLMGTEHPEYLARFAKAARPVSARVRALITTLLITALVPTAALAKTPADFAGDWLTSSGAAVVRLGPCRAKPSRLCGVLVEVRNPAVVRSGLAGRRVLKDFVWRNGAWRGYITDLSTGEMRRGAVRLTGTAQRWVCARPLCSDSVWRRIN